MRRGRRPTARGDGHYELALSLLSAGRLREAAGELELAVSSSPSDFEACYELGRLYSQLGKHRRAYVFFRRAALIAPGDARAHFQAGLELLGDEEFARAAREFGKAAALAPLDAECHYHLGLALFGCGRHLEAIKRLAAARRLSPDSAKVHHVIGAVYRSLGRDAQSLRHLRRAVKLDPHDAELRAAAAETCLAVGEGGEALAHLIEAVQLRPDDPVLLQALLTTYDQAVVGDAEARELLDVLEEVVAWYPKTKSAHDRLAELYELAGEYEKAARCVVQSLQIDPDDPYTRLRAASVMLRRHRPVEALHVLRGVAREMPHDFSVQLLYAKACSDRGLFHAAEHAFRRCLRIAPDRPEAYVGLASVTEACGDREGTREYLRKALSVSPDDTKLARRLHALVEAAEATRAKWVRNN